MGRTNRVLRTEATAAVWKSEVAHTRELTDALGKTIDPGIENTVTALRLMGFQTSGSCEGHLDWGCATPWVTIDGADVNPERTKQSVDALLTEFYGTRRVDPKFRLTTELYDPYDDGTMSFGLSCSGSDEFDEAGRIGRIRPMASARREMEAFTDFLIEQHLAPALEASAGLEAPAVPTPSIGDDGIGLGLIFRG